LTINDIFCRISFRGFKLAQGVEFVKHVFDCSTSNEPLLGLELRTQDKTWSKQPTQIVEQHSQEQKQEKHSLSPHDVSAKRNSTI
jgi:hypothetical protein